MDWSALSILLNEYGGSSPPSPPGSKTVWALTGHVHPELILGMHGTVPLLHLTYSMQQGPSLEANRFSVS